MGEVRWYDKEGKPISDMELMELRLSDPNYKRVAKTIVGDAEVSTVWLGLDHSYFDDSPPLIFETLVFGGKHDQHMVRYSTEEEAREGHARVVRMVTPWWRRWGVKLSG